MDCASGAEVVKRGAKRPRIVVTRKEALLLLGIRKGALASLESAAQVRPSDRAGYTDEELKRLVAELKRILTFRF